MLCTWNEVSYYGDQVRFYVHSPTFAIPGMNLLWGFQTFLFGNLESVA